MDHGLVVVLHMLYTMQVAHAVISALLHLNCSVLLALRTVPVDPRS